MLRKKMLERHSVTCDFKHIYIHTHIYTYICVCIHIFSTVQVSHLKNRTKTNKQKGFRWDTSRVPSSAAAAASLPGFPRESLEPGLCGNTVQYPPRPQEGSAHPRTSARKTRWTLRSALHAPKVSSLGSSGIST